jgi:hypothetical protein
MVKCIRKFIKSTRTVCQRTINIAFFRGAKYEFTFNEEGKFSNAQMAILFELPSQQSIDEWRKIKVLAAPPGIKDIDFDEDADKESYIRKGFQEVLVGLCPERTKFLKSNIQA